MAITVAAVRESAADEARVALTPAVVSTLVKGGAAVVIEAGAGDGAHYTDQDFADAGATVVSSAAKAVKPADVLVCVGRPDAKVLGSLTSGQVIVGLLDSWDTDALTDLADRGVTVLSLDKLPRQISRAQSMDVLSSQASIAGYRAVIVAAEAYGRYFPMMVTAAGTAKPASVLVLGAGVAGLQAIATARRLGARVTGYDVRPAARDEVASLGAQFLETSVSAADSGGYARQLTDKEAKTQQRELSEAIARFDIVITTAKVPGRKPPLLVTAQTVAAMKRGSVVVDLGASDRGGNVAGSHDGHTVVTKNGVAVIGAGNLPATMAAAASDAYARNVAAVLGAVIADGALAIDASDDVIGALMIAPTRPKALDKEEASA